MSKIIKIENCRECPQIRVLSDTCKLLNKEVPESGIRPECPLTDAPDVDSDAAEFVEWMRSHDLYDVNVEFDRLYQQYLKTKQS